MTEIAAMLGDTIAIVEKHYADLASKRMEERLSKISVRSWGRVRPLTEPTPIPRSKCTCRSDCPATFAFASVPRSQKAEKDKENQLAEDFLRSYSQTSK